MRNPFKSKYRITQPFGSDHFLTINKIQIKASEYYGKFGLKGHEGIDLVPTGSVWDVLAFVDGVVVNETDDPRSGAYGIWCTIWHPQLKKATQYCHLQGNYVSSGDKVTAGQKIGYMGSTGNVSGAHLHLNLYNVDDNGVRLNRNNGYNGGIDPLPFLEEEGATTTPDNDTQKIIDELRADRDRNWQLYQAENQKVQDLEFTLQKKNDSITSLDRKNQELNATNINLSASVDRLTTEKNNAVQGEKDAKSALTKVQMDLDICKAQRKDLAKYTTRELIHEIFGRFHV